MKPLKSKLQFYVFFFHFLNHVSLILQDLIQQLQEKAVL